VGNSADPRNEQCLRPLEVIRYSNVDEETRANQPINPAVEKTGKYFSLQGDRPVRWQIPHDLFSKQVHACVD
jgi:hypothetical protein